MSAPIDTGGPAYTQNESSWYAHLGRKPAPSGMTLLDWFAGQALAAMLPDGCIHLPDESVCDDAYRYARAMLAERKRLGVE